MTRIPLYTILLLVVALLPVAAQPADSSQCRKLEVALYLSTALDDKKQVLQYLEALRKCGDDSPPILLAVSRYLNNRGSYTASDEPIHLLLKNRNVSSRQQGEGYFYLGLNAFGRSENVIAIEHLLKASSLGFKPFWCYNTIGLVYAHDRDYARAIEYYKKSLASEPGYPVALNNMGLAFSKMGKKEMALRYYEMADSAGNGSVALYRSNITRCLRNIDYEREMQSALIGIQKFPKNKSTVYDMGIASNHAGNYDMGLQYGRKLLKLNPHTAEDWFAVGSLYSGAGSDSAAYYYKKTLLLNPRHAMANHNLGLFYQLRGKPEKAHEYLDRALDINPADELSINSKIHTYLWQYDFENAYKWCLKYNALYMGGKYSYLNTGYVLMNLKRYTEAIPWFEKKLGQDPKDDRAYNDLGRCYAKLGQYNKALSYFDTAFSINPANAYTFHNRASLYNDMGKYALACADLKMAIDNQYTWIIDSALVEMKNKHCRDINTNRKIIIHAYRDNAKNLKKNDFIELLDSIADPQPADTVEKTPIRAVIAENQTGSSDAQNSFNLYPNPSAGPFYVERIAWSDEVLEIKIFDLQGKALKNIPFSGQRTEVDASLLANGIYVVMVLDSTSVLSTQKLIISR